MNEQETIILRKDNKHKTTITKVLKLYLLEQEYIFDNGEKQKDKVYLLEEDIKELIKILGEPKK